MSFKCVIVTPEAQMLDAQVKQAILPAHDGLMGVLTGRAPILVKLGLGALTVDLIDSNKRQVYFVDGGVAQVKDNVLTVCTTEATPVEELDASKAEKELAEVTAAKAGEKIPADLRERSVRRAKTKIALSK